MAEISLAAPRRLRLRLRQLADEGDTRAERLLRMQEQPDDYFTEVQVSLNAVAMLVGIVGEEALSLHFAALFGLWPEPARADTANFSTSFLVITSLFILFADLFPKRLVMTGPEQLPIRVAPPMAMCIMALRPLVWLYLRAAHAVSHLLGLPALRDDKITSDDVLAMMEAGALGGAAAPRAAGHCQRV